jgi:prepilin-type N-terminal cleavage/methylation domain-containing protein
VGAKRIVKRACREPHGFTVIELLVVMSIISLLVDLAPSGVWQSLSTRTGGEVIGSVSF